MFIECLKRELAVCHHAEIGAFLAADPGRWQVISIREPHHPEAVLTHARKAHAIVFEDVFTPEGTHGHGPKPAHLQGILARCYSFIPNKSWRLIKKCIVIGT
jgi:hypothetical protein